MKQKILVNYVQYNIQLLVALSGLVSQNFSIIKFLVIFLKKTFPIIKKRNLPYNFFFLLYLGKAIFRTLAYLELGALFKSLVYIEPKAYLEHYQTSMMERFFKSSCLAHFLIPNSKIKKSSDIVLYFRKWNFLVLLLRNFLYFLKGKLVYISGIGKLENNSYISANGTFLYFRKLLIL